MHFVSAKNGPILVFILKALLAQQEFLMRLVETVKNPNFDGLYDEWQQNEFLVEPLSCLPGECAIRTLSMSPNIRTTKVRFN